VRALAEPVPKRSFDAASGVWHSEAPGRVVAVVATDGGVATLDTDGDGLADNDAALGITTDERVALAALYSPGQELWRVPITHFSDDAWDDPGDGSFDGGASYPPDPDPANGRQNLDNPSRQCGSTIRVENASMSETVPIAGTPFALSLRQRAQQSVRLERPRAHRARLRTERYAKPT